MKLMSPCGWKKTVIGLTAICLLATLVDTAGIPRIATSRSLTTTCFGNLGCFSIDREFCDPPYRPKCLPPQNEIDTKFLLYTNPSPSDYTLLDATMDSLQKSAFNASLKTKVIIHGFLVKSSSFGIALDIKDSLLRHDNYNVIFVDWSQSNGDLLNLLAIPQAIANGRVVGAQTASLLQFIKGQTGIKLEDTHILGHSLGAHVCGWAGERLTNLGRISGLDPAGLYFHNATNRVRLDKTDTLFLDVIHTNGGTNNWDGVGTLEAIGDLDFYPNGGSLQPGCSIPIIGGLLDLFMHIDDCSHSRVVYLYNESISQTSCTFRGLPCDSWADYQAGKCNNRSSVVMGFYAVKPERINKSRKIYLVTNAASPFCIGN